MDTFVIDPANTAWVLLSAALVLLMTPALALFYGGMVRSKSVLNMMLMSFSALGVVGVVYLLWGYSMSFGSDVGGLVGNPLQLFGVANLADGDPSDLMAGHGVPAYAFLAFQATFAIITVALLSGAVADRLRFSAWLLLTLVWSTLVYFPLAHMVWGGGLLSGAGPIGHLATPMDFAGGSVVEIGAGVAGLVLAVVLGARKGFGKDPMRPHNLPFTMLGAGLLWFGWLGFNAGSAGAADHQAAIAWVNTTAAACTGLLGWLVVERVRDGKATSLGAVSGAVAGLVAATPSSGYVAPPGALVLGLVAGMLGAGAVGLKFRLGYDDSLDLVAVHLVGGLVGTIGIGLFATGPDLLDGARRGLFYGGGLAQLGAQTALALAALAFSAVVTAAIAVALRRVMALRVPAEHEIGGVDLALHGETAYEGIASGRLASGA
ncbi:ammonium transporter [Isoptericola sp. b441]|uniref:Ammonium transporter n=1 Tax=Actinotalea lenta TaxID=3064654 RepID=A0ABT9DE45_9CELL|nr:ammonium transporter [Isoptericola sp. b441]MDO8107322.1 ammonium transporter [Isoptericola sp. b441]